MDKPDSLGPARKSVRLCNYDYSSPAAYFVTICTAQRRCLFGDVQNGKLEPNPWGSIVLDAWLWLAKQYDYVQHDAWSLMPNHLHAIINLLPSDSPRKPIGQLVGAFKTVSTKCINQLRQTDHPPIWQRGFYEHVIRSERALDQCRVYIEFNCRQWEIDCHPLPYRW